jgi:hypothetical protein
MKETLLRVEVAFFAAAVQLQEGKVESKLVFSMVMLTRLLLK